MKKKDYKRDVVAIIVGLFIFTLFINFFFKKKTNKYRRILISPYSCL